MDILRASSDLDTHRARKGLIRKSVVATYRQIRVKIALRSRRGGRFSHKARLSDEHSFDNCSKESLLSKTLSQERSQSLFEADFPKSKEVMSSSSIAIPPAPSRANMQTSSRDMLNKILYPITNMFHNPKARKPVSIMLASSLHFPLSIPTQMLPSVSLYEKLPEVDHLETPTGLINTIDSTKFLSPKPPFIYNLPPELLVSILSHLSISDYLTLKRTSRALRTIITTNAATLCNQLIRLHYPNEARYLQATHVQGWLVPRHSLIARFEKGCASQSQGSQKRAKRLSSPGPQFLSFLDTYGMEITAYWNWHMEPPRCHDRLTTVTTNTSGPTNSAWPIGSESVGQEALKTWLEIQTRTPHCPWISLPTPRIFSFRQITPPPSFRSNNNSATSHQLSLSQTSTSLFRSSNQFTNSPPSPTLTSPSTPLSVGSSGLWDVEINNDAADSAAENRNETLDDEVDTNKTAVWRQRPDCFESAVGVHCVRRFLTCSAGEAGLDWFYLSC